MCGAVLKVFPGGSAGDVAYRRGYGGAGCPQVFGNINCLGGDEG